MDVEKRPPSKFAAFFSGTQEKCISCEKTVYPLEKVSIDGMTYHKSCFKCCHGGCSLNPSNHIAHEGRLYCKHHHAQLFLEKGNYSKLEVLPAVKASVEDGTF
ncbi:hypothetical protein KP509_11G018100 [Ceratopteris richardii]|nr:hypothetical protein KP509_11G018100 [Ceratopteris richardii]